MTHAKIVAAVVASTLLTLAADAASGTIVQAKPGSYYLALGDSMAYGMQPQKAGLPPSKVRTGYVDVFAASLRKTAPKIRVVNYGCPGEAAKTFIGGGCPWLGEGRKLHDPFKGPQLAAALAFLEAHPGQVSPITVTLWGNDLFEDFAPSCNGDPLCVKARSKPGLARLQSRLTTIVRKLRAAAPKAEIILTGAWNFDVQHFKKVDPLFRSIDAAIATAARSGNARVAKMFPVFNPPGKEKAAVCRLTYICSKGDPHPTDAGYRGMAGAFLAASGYR